MAEVIALSIPTTRAQAPVLTVRRSTHKIRVGSPNVSRDASIAVQPMTIMKTYDIGATLQQIAEPTAVGCDIVRVACPTDRDAGILPIIVKQSRVPVIADIYFDPKYIFTVIEADCDAVRVNPGNIRKLDDQVADIHKAASNAGVFLHVGVNAGSLDKHLLKKYGKATPEAFMESATWEAGLSGENGFHDFKISVKHHDVAAMVQAYRLLSEAGQWPLHLGMTKVGSAFQGTTRSCVVFGIPLAEGIGDATRVSLSAPLIEEVKVGAKLLEFMGLRERQLEIISRFPCGQAQADVQTPAKEMEAGLKRVTASLHVVVMGCVINGPGEAREADLSYASGNGEGQIFVRGQVVEAIPEDQVVETLLKHAEAVAAEIAEELGEEILVGTGPMALAVG